jgi:hypothetical protein
MASPGLAPAAAGPGRKPGRGQGIISPGPGKRPRCGYTSQEALEAGVLDVLEIQLRPFLPGQGRRLFHGLRPEHIELSLVRKLQARRTRHLQYEV